SGGASRFFPTFRYQAKAPKSERPRLPDGTAWPTVKPVALMRWLVRLVTPPGGLVLDPFAGTGTTLQAAALEGMHAIGIERDETAAQLCRIRLGEPADTTPTIPTQPRAAAGAAPKPKPPKNPGDTLLDPFSIDEEEGGEAHGA